MLLNQYDRAASYVKVRLFPVFMLWMAVVAGVHLIPAANHLIHRESTKVTNLAGLADAMGLVLILIGFGVLKLTFGVAEHMLPNAPEKHKYITRFFQRIWNEISSAATHLCCSMFAVSFWGANIEGGWRLSAAAGLLGWFAYSWNPATDSNDVVTQ